MGVNYTKIELSTLGNFDLIDITRKVKDFVFNQNIANGLVNISVKGSMASIIMLENENGIIDDFKKIVEKLFPMTDKYEHDENWHDRNGFSHLRGIFTKNSISIPIIEKNLELDTWQQIYLVDYDNKPRKRVVIIQIIY